MAKNVGASSYTRVQEEVHQGHSVRENLYERLETLLGGDTRVISYFTSSVWPVQIDTVDADMLEEFLQNVDLSAKSLTLVINSLGGDALGAERIVNICRSYAKHGFNVIVPKMAKSAATMICFGADKIGMSATSELGPIDPQIIMDDRQYAAHHIVESYEELMKDASAAKGKVDPFLLQLQRYDSRDIHWIKSAQELSARIAVHCLQLSMMKGKSASQIKTKIKPFLNPAYTTVHGRPITHEIALKTGLKLTLYDLKSEIWQVVWELYVRLSHLTSQKCSKAIEYQADMVMAPIPHRSS